MTATAQGGVMPLDPAAAVAAAGPMTPRGQDLAPLPVALGEVLSGPALPQLDAVVRLAARVCAVPRAAVNMVDGALLHEVATWGMEPEVCRVEDALCAEVLQHPGLLVVPDASRDPRFADNVFVDGRRGDIRFYASHPLVDRAGRVLGTLCVFDDEPRDLADVVGDLLPLLAEEVVDVLELQRRNRELDDLLAETRETAAQLAASNERLAAFAGQVAHDLRSPLAVILGSLELAEEVPEMLGRATGAAHRMSALVEHVLEFARLGGAVALDDVDLEQVARDALRDLAVLATESGAEVVVHPLPTVRGDATQLRALLQNLLANAMTHTRPGLSPRVEVVAERGAGEWRIEVVDDGPGVPESQRRRIFEPLVRLGGDDGPSGHGIGLATCRRVAEAHGGRIGVTGRPGSGAVFWFTLPDA